MWDVMYRKIERWTDASRIMVVVGKDRKKVRETNVMIEEGRCV